MSSMFKQNVSIRILILKRHQAIQFGSVKAYLKAKALLPVDVHRSKLKNAFALACRHLLFPSMDRNFLSVSNSRTLSFVENARFWCEQKDKFLEIPLLETLLILPNPSFKKNFSHLVESENDWTLIYIHPKIENYPATSDATRAG